MNKKYPWLPIDERLIPDIFSWKYPKDRWVRWALFTELICALIAVIGTFAIALFFKFPKALPTATSTSITSPNPNP